jgi:hypothetical protein
MALIDILDSATSLEKTGLAKHAKESPCFLCGLASLRETLFFSHSSSQPVALDKSNMLLPHFVLYIQQSSIETNPFGKPMPQPRRRLRQPPTGMKMLSQRSLRSSLVFRIEAGYKLGLPM